MGWVFGVIAESQITTSVPGPEKRLSKPSLAHWTTSLGGGDVIVRLHLQSIARQEDLVLSGNDVNLDLGLMIVVVAQDKDLQPLPPIWIWARRWPQCRTDVLLDYD
jgi:hypothetical protein